MTTVETSCPAILDSPTNGQPLGGNQTNETRPQAILLSPTSGEAPGGANTQRAKLFTAAEEPAPAGVDTRPTAAVSLPSGAASGGTSTRQTTDPALARETPPAGNDSRPASAAPASMRGTSGGVDDAGHHVDGDVHSWTAASAQSADRHVVIDAQMTGAVGSQLDGQAALGAHIGTAVDQPGLATKVVSTIRSRSLLDPALAFAADVLDDIERVRIANENRLRQLTRAEEDSDGEVRGFGLDESHPDVARLAAIVGTLAEVEKDAAKHLEKVMKRHPLHPWAKSMKGVGDKQIARLLAVIGDPYWRPEIARDDDTAIPAGPRTVSALWAYCGLHCLPVGGHVAGVAHNVTATDGANFPAGHHQLGAHEARAGRDQLADRHLGQRIADPHGHYAWVAARRQRGQKANWSTKAKTRAYLIAESCSKQLRKPCGAGDHVEDCECSPYRLKYEARKAATADRLHAAACVRCAPSGKPAQPGTPWSDGHKHADALRIVAKEILKDLWRAARQLHLEAGGQP